MSHEQISPRDGKPEIDEELPFMDPEHIAEAQAELSHLPGGDPGDSNLISRVIARSLARRMLEDSTTEEDIARNRRLCDDMDQVVAEYRAKIGLPPEKTSSDSE